MLTLMILILFLVVEVVDYGGILEKTSMEDNNQNKDQDQGREEY